MHADRQQQRQGAVLQPGQPDARRFGRRLPVQCWLLPCRHNQPGHEPDPMCQYVADQGPPPLPCRAVQCSPGRYSCPWLLQDAAHAPAASMRTAAVSRTWSMPTPSAQVCDRGCMHRSRQCGTQSSPLQRCTTACATVNYATAVWCTTSSDSVAEGCIANYAVASDGQCTRMLPCMCVSVVRSPC
jgi:hypothetical protein